MNNSNDNPKSSQNILSEGESNNLENQMNNLHIVEKASTYNNIDKFKQDLDENYPPNKYLNENKKEVESEFQKINEQNSNKNITNSNLIEEIKDEINEMYPQNLK